MAGVFGQVDKVTKYPEIELEVRDGITYNLCKGGNINIHASLIPEYTWDCLDIPVGSGDVDGYSILVYWGDGYNGFIVEDYCTNLQGYWLGGNVNHTYDYPGIYNIVVICTYPDAPGDYNYIDSTIYSATVIVTDCSTPATTTTTSSTTSSTTPPTTSSTTPPTTSPPNLCPMPDVPETPAFPPPYSLPTTQTSNPLDINNVSVVAINPLVDKIITTTTTTTTSTTTSTTIAPTSTTINIAPCKTGCKSLNF